MPRGLSYPRSSRILVLVVVFVATLALVASAAGCGKSKKAATTVTPAVSTAIASSPTAVKATATPASSAGSSASVEMRNIAYQPKSVTISKGGTVTWTNKDSVDHTVTGDNITMESGTLSPDQTFSFTFNQTGVFRYHCSIHGTIMSGTVTVE